MLRYPLISIELAEHMLSHLDRFRDAGLKARPGEEAPPDAPRIARSRRSLLRLPG